MLKIPFIENPGNQCIQTNMMMALQHFFPDKEFTFDEVNEKMHWKKGKWTFPAQAAVALKDFGLAAKAFSSQDVYASDRADAEEFFKKIFGSDYETLIDNIDFDVFVDFHKRAKEENVFEIRRNSLDDFEKYVEKGYIVIPSIDWNVLHHIKGPFQGHAVTIIKISKDHVWINDPDEGPNIEYPRKLFKEAYTVPAIDDDVLVIFGKSSH